MVGRKDQTTANFRCNSDLFLPTTAESGTLAPEGGVPDCELFLPTTAEEFIFFLYTFHQKIISFDLHLSNLFFCRGW